jgi:hypothetical protein
MKSKPVQIKRVVPEFTEAIPEPGDPEVGLLDFIDPEQPHYHEKFPDDGSEILYEFGDDPTIYIKVNGKNRIRTARLVSGSQTWPMGAVL